MKDSFDNKIKEALENFEMPYDANSWAELEKQLPKQSTPAPTNSGSSGWKLIAAAAVIISAATLVWFSQEKEQLQTATELVTETEITSTKTEETKGQVLSEDFETPTPERENNSENQEKVSQETVASDQEESSNAIKTSTPESTLEIPEDQETAQDEDAGSELNSTVSEGNTEAVETTQEKFLDVDVEVSAKTVCTNEDINFISEANVDNVNYTWDFGDGNVSSEQNPTHSFVSAGTYDVKMKASSGNAKRVDKQFMVLVNPSPTPVLSAERKLNGYQAIPLYILTTATQPSETATWAFSDGSQIDGNHALHLFRNGGKQTATLNVTNKFGCVTQISQEFDLNKFNLLAPTAFTPDGDGINESFIPKALPEMGLAFEMTIQDPKTGQIVYRTEDSKAPWNGTLNNSGTELDNGVYIWTVVLKDNVVKNQVFTETINLQR